MLSRYLGVEQRKDRINILTDTEALQGLLAATNAPLGKWPSPGHTPLVTLQQAVTNHALGGPAAPRPLGRVVGVNGPPGTGKTTLVKDIVAGNVVARASAMAKFFDPRHAFGKSLKNGVYEIDESLRGFEMMVGLGEQRRGREHLQGVAGGECDRWRSRPDASAETGRSAL